MTDHASFEDAVRAMTDGATVLVSSPSSHRFAIKMGDRLMFEHGADPNAESNAFELRGFNETSEWRWIRRGSTGVFSTVSDASMTDAGAHLLGPGGRTSYICWGSNAGGGSGGRSSQVAEGWSRLRSEAVNDLLVPLAGGTDGDIAVIDVVEYVQEDGCGNARVVDQRLVKLRWRTPDDDPKGAR